MEQNSMTDKVQDVLDKWNKPTDLNTNFPGLHPDIHMIVSQVILKMGVEVQEAYELEIEKHQDETSMLWRQMND